MKQTHPTSEMLHDSKLYAAPKELSLKDKIVKKKKLLKSLNINKNGKDLLLVFELDTSDTNKQFLFEEIMDGLAQLPINVVVLGKKKDHFDDFYNVRYLANTKQNKKTVCEGADLFLLTGDIHTEELCLKNGTPGVFLGSEMYAGEFMEFNPLKESGNGFSCKKETSWILFATIVQVLETYKFPYDWETICKNAFATGQGL